MGNRTAHVNEIRGMLAEFGIEIPQGRCHVAPTVAEILGDGGTDKVTLPPRFLGVLAELYEALLDMDKRVAHYDAMIDQVAQEDEQAQLLMTVPGVGPMTATAMLSTMGDPGGVPQWAGNTPPGWGLSRNKSSTGGKERLLGISKRGGPLPAVPADPWGPIRGEST